ncbi:MAG: endo-1,4-beta-xylanase, partial [Bacteroidales bacterium]|nr:endo-1,4-beta-xylanase [Bacteroidales bacterium]
MEKHVHQSRSHAHTLMQCLSVFFVLLLGIVATAQAQTGLKDIYASHFRVGNIMNSGVIQNATIKTQTIREYNSISCENEMKPNATLTQSGSTDDDIKVTINSAKNIMQFCSDNKIPMRGHVLVWHGQSPHWFFTADLKTPSTPGDSKTVNWATKAQMEKRLKSYINNLFKLIKETYPNLNVYAYDVVNEAVNVKNGKGCPRDGGFDVSGVTGGLEPSNNGNSPWVKIYGDNSFIESAFKYADEARKKYFPNMKLFYNDFNEWDTPKRDYIIESILKPLKAKGYLDGMGMQGHVDCDPGQWAWSRTAIFTEAMSKYAALGVEVHITELDVGKKNFSTTQQATKYKEIFDYAIKVNATERPKGNPGFTAIVVWGQNDANTWRGDDEATMFDKSNNKKEAYTQVAALVPQSQWGDGTNPSFVNVIYKNTPTYTLTTALSPSAGGSITQSVSGTSFAQGATVTLTAVAKTGWTFDGWSGDASGTGASTTLTMNANKSVTAKFKLTGTGDENLIKDGNFPGSSLTSNWT